MTQSNRIDSVNPPLTESNRWQMRPDPVNPPLAGEGLDAETQQLPVNPPLTGSCCF